MHVHLRLCAVAEIQYSGTDHDVQLESLHFILRRLQNTDRLDVYPISRVLNHDPLHRSYSPTIALTSLIPFITDFAYPLIQFVVKP